jgi:hypothetical protein
MTKASPADMWHYRDGGAPTEDIAGFAIEARDGDIGRVDKANAETGMAYLIVATGPWIFGRTVMLPAGVIDRIDYKRQVVHVNRDMEAIKNAPEYDGSHHDDDENYRSGLGDYYAGLDS